MQASFESRIRKFPKLFDEGRAARALDALGSRAGSGALKELVAAVASNSAHLARVLEREAEFAGRLVDEDPDRAIEAALSTLDEVPGAPRQDAMRILREAKRRVSLIVALADTGGLWGLDQVTAALTQLADRTLRAALHHSFNDAVARGRISAGLDADPVASCGLFFLAMGKYGAFELNY